MSLTNLLLLLILIVLMVPQINVRPYTSNAVVTLLLIVLTVVLVVFVLGQGRLLP